MNIDTLKLGDTEIKIWTGNIGLVSRSYQKEKKSLYEICFFWKQSNKGIIEIRFLQFVRIGKKCFQMLNSEIWSCILVLSGDCNRKPHNGHLLKSRNSSLTSLRLGSPRLRSQQIQRLVRTCFLVCWWLSSHYRLTWKKWGSSLGSLL